MGQIDADDDLDGALDLEHLLVALSVQPMLYQHKCQDQGVQYNLLSTAG